MKILSDRRRGWRVKVGERKRGRMESEGKGRGEKKREEERGWDGREWRREGKGR